MTAPQDRGAVRHKPHPLWPDLDAVIKSIVAAEQERNPIPEYEPRFVACPRCGVELADRQARDGRILCWRCRDKS